MDVFVVDSCCCTRDMRTCLIKDHCEAFLTWSRRVQTLQLVFRHPEKDLPEQVLRDTPLSCELQCSVYPVGMATVLHKMMVLYVDICPEFANMVEQEGPWSQTLLCSLNQPPELRQDVSLKTLLLNARIPDLHIPLSTDTIGVSNNL